MSKATYTETNVAKALQAVKNGSSLREAAKIFNVPKSTISDRMPKKSATIGRPCSLSQKVERDLANWIRFMTAACMPVTRKQFVIALTHALKSAGEENRFKNGIPSYGWLDKFQKRNKLSTRIPEPVSRAMALQTEESIRKWFDYVSNELSNLGISDILEDPARIFNTDETGLALEPSGFKVIHLLIVYIY